MIQSLKNHLSKLRGRKLKRSLNPPNLASPNLNSLPKEKIHLHHLTQNPLTYPKDPRNNHFPTFLNNTQEEGIKSVYEPESQPPPKRSTIKIKHPQPQPLPISPPKQPSPSSTQDYELEILDTPTPQPLPSLVLPLQPTPKPTSPITSKKKGSFSCQGNLIISHKVYMKS